MALDGIDLSSDSALVLYRSHLVERVMGYLAKSSFVVVAAPPATGKTSLLQLVGQRCRNAEYDTYFLRFSEADDPFARLREITGIDLLGNTSAKPSGKTKVLFLDDCQTQFSNPSFWEHLCKGQTQNKLSAEFRVVFACTYNLSTRGSPVCFRSFQGRLNRRDLLLTTEEAIAFFTQFLERSRLSAWEKMHSLRHALLSDSAGQVGLLSLYMTTLALDSDKGQATEARLIQSMLSCATLNRIQRCFPLNGLDTGSVPPAEKEFLIDLYRSGDHKKQMRYRWNNDKEAETIRGLARAGILDGEEDVDNRGGMFALTSPVTLRFMLFLLFGERPLQLPGNRTLVDLSVACAKGLRTSLLVGATSNGDRDMPKETSFQHMFMMQLFYTVPVEHMICPEMSNILGGPKIKGELDFFIDGSLRFGLELLVGGKGVGEHISRFSTTGKYAILQAADYIVIDFRLDKNSPVHRHEKRMTVFFNLEFTFCTCEYGKKNGCNEALWTKTFDLPP